MTAQYESLMIPSSIRMLVKFTKPEFPGDPNDFMPATVSIYNGPTRPSVHRLYVQWDHGRSSVDRPSDLVVRTMT